MDIVYISGLRVDAVIGVFEWEQNIRQPLVFDLSMGVDCQPAAKNDDIQLALDYAEVSEFVTFYTADSRYKLVETLAESLAEQLMAKFAIGWIQIKIAKPNAVLNAAEVGVIIERGVKS